MTSKTVFISYSHDSNEHRERVLALSERLREDGITTLLDQYVNGSPAEGWARWMLNQLDEADSVLAVCTETYYRRFRGREEPGKGKGADWEGGLITQEIYDDRSTTLKFIPILFTPTDEPFIPEPIRGQTYYLVNSDSAYNELYDFLLGQAGVEPRAVGKARLKERRKGAPLKFDQLPPYSVPQTQIAPSRLHHGADRLFGREQELAALDELAADPTKKVLTIVAFGGVGKTSLVIEWMAQQAAKNWHGFQRVFDWSFFSQGTREQGSASADAFVAAALRFFGDDATAESSASAWDKGARLAQLVSGERSLLVLDGVEPLQHPPGPLAGELKDPALISLLKGLARQNAGLCIVTSREHVTDLAPFRSTTAPEWALHHLSISAGIELLKSLGVHGTGGEFEVLVKEVKAHALTLNLLGRYIARAHQGDIRKHDQVKFEKADAQIQGGYAFKTIGAYENWLGQGDAGTRALAVLRLLGLFDRPADYGCLKALLAEPAIPGLTELLMGLDDTDWNIAVSSLAECGLVSVQSNNATVGTSPSAIDAHPLIRQYFAEQLKNADSDAWRAAHQRLYEYLCKTQTDQLPQPRLEDLQPLYQAIAHACQAELHREALHNVYVARTLRGTRSGGFYSLFRLGAFGADLGAVACFFDRPWNRVSSLLDSEEAAWLLNMAFYDLRALGRVIEALEPARAGMQMRVKHENWREAALNANNLSELEMTLGKLPEAVADAELSITYADRSGDLHLRQETRCTYAHALHQVGAASDADGYFRTAEEIQAKGQPEEPLLYSTRGFRYCDFMLAAAERAAWQKMLTLYAKNRSSELSAAYEGVSRRAAQTYKWVQAKSVDLLSAALDNLTLGRAALYKAILEDSSVTDASSAQLAVQGMRQAGTKHWIPAALRSRAWLRFLNGARIGSESAQQDLDEAWEIADRGPMKLFMADIHLDRARLFHDVKPYPWTSPQEDLSAGRKLIEQCGYWRRKEELEDAEESSKTW